MIVTRSHVKTAGWAAVLMGCAAGVAMLAFKVNSVRSEVRQAETLIVQLQRDNLYLETEFETRASQQQLAALNRSAFNYIAPGPAQFLPNERALASLGEPRSKDAPQMIRVARSIVGAEMQQASDENPGAKPDTASRAEKPDVPTFQRAVLEKAGEADEAEPGFAALFAEYSVDGPAEGAE